MWMRGSIRSGSARRCLILADSRGRPVCLPFSNTSTISDITQISADLNPGCRVCSSLSPPGCRIEKGGHAGSPLPLTIIHCPLSITDQQSLPCDKANPVHGEVRCGDVLRFLPDFADDTFDVVVADPPYNIGKDFGNDSDNRELADYALWADEWARACLRVVKPGAPVYIYGWAEILAHVAVRFPVHKQRWLAWHYTNKTVPSSKFWQRSHESILCLWKGERPRIHVDAVREQYTDTFLNGSAGKTRNATPARYSNKGKQTIYTAHPKGALPRDVIKVAALAGGAGFAERWFYCKTCKTLCNPHDLDEHRQHDTIRHPTQKPSEISRKLLESAATAGDYALIPFAGSGAECVVAKQLGINFFAAEINPDYVQLANAWLYEGRDDPARAVR